MKFLIIINSLGPDLSSILFRNHKYDFFIPDQIYSDTRIKKKTNVKRPIASLQVKNNNKKKKLLIIRVLINNVFKGGFICFPVDSYNYFPHRM